METDFVLFLSTVEATSTFSSHAYEFEPPGGSWLCVSSVKFEVFFIETKHHWINNFQAHSKVLKISLNLLLVLFMN